MPDGFSVVPEDLRTAARGLEDDSEGIHRTCRDAVTAADAAAGACGVAVLTAAVERFADELQLRYRHLSDVTGQAADTLAANATTYVDVDTSVKHLLDGQLG